MKEPELDPYSWAMLNQCAIEPQVSNLDSGDLVSEGLVEARKCPCGCTAKVISITTKGRKLARKVFGADYQKSHWQRAAFVSLKRHTHA